MIEPKTPRELAHRLDELNELAEILPEGVLAYRTARLVSGFLESVLDEEERPDTSGLLESIGALAPGLAGERLRAVSDKESLSLSEGHG